MLDCGDSDLEEIGGMAPGEIVVMQREESVRQRKGKWIAGPFGVVESGDDGESISPRTYRVNLGLDPNEMDLVEGWVEHVRELSRGHDDPDSDPDSWAWLANLVEKQKLGAKRAEEKKAKGVGSEVGVSLRPSLGNEEDVEILEESTFTRKAKKPRTASSKSSQNLAVEAGDSTKGNKELKPQNSERPDYNQLVHIRKMIKGEPSNINPEVFDMIHPHLQQIRLLSDERDKVDLAAAESDVAEFLKRSDLANQAQEVMAQALAEANVQCDALIYKIAQLEETVEKLRAEDYDLRVENQKLRLEVNKLKGANLKLKSEAEDMVKAWAFFFNFGARQVLTEVKGLYPNLDLSAIEADYPAHEEAEDGADQPPADGA
ncbi:hypothetical protein Fot_32452 [Forsythia ovata]|uniref:Uncharacterized protein n=1 Tax=Forsythia ovata TaxID=205694 RepID=A0ABD1T890_9LAMI